MSHRFWLVLLVVVSGLSVYLCDSPDHLKVCGELDPLTRRALAHHHLQTHREGSVTFIELTNKDKLVAVLSQVINSYQQERDTILSNIDNAEKPLRQRKRVNFADDGTVASIDDVDQDFQWVYDPTHPSAGQCGPQKGYVPMPNINVECERRLLERVDQRLALVRLLLQKVDPEILVPETIELNQSTEGPLAALHTAAEEMSYQPSYVHPVGWEIGSPPLKSHFDLKPEKTAARTCPPVKQSNKAACGQASVAFALNALSGASLSDLDIDRVYGFRLLDALNAESRSCGYVWRDAGNVSEKSQRMVQDSVSLGLPVLVALNGPEFSANPAGCIFAIVDMQGNTVTYADPRDGKLKTKPWEAMVQAPSHPDGNFLFVAEKLK